MTEPTFLWRVEIRVPAAAVPWFEDALGPDFMAISSFGDEADDLWRVEGFVGAEPDVGALGRRLAKVARDAGLEAPRPKVHLVPPRDWVAENMAAFPPRRVARYFIHGSHFRDPVPAGLIGLKLDAGAAFGSGEHPSTAACLMAVAELAKGRRFLRPLDMGCGSGVLALAMAKTWRASVVASDIDDEAVRVTLRNARANGVGPLIRATPGQGYRSPAVAGGGPYDLIVANILAAPLCRMAGDLAGHLAARGVAVVSGLLERDGVRVLSAHRRFGLRLVRNITIDGWRTIVMAR